MKQLFLLIFLFIGLGQANAQYDFPVVINGLSISLDLGGRRVVYPYQWLQAGIGDCWPDSLLISRSVFPRGTTPPASAADSLLFDCNDFSSESVEIWWKGQQEEWLVADSYALISGFDSCGCVSACPAVGQPILLNGYSAAYDQGDSIVIAAKELVAVDFPGQTFTFGPSIKDSIRTFRCADGPVITVEIFAQSAGASSRSAQTYLALNSENCGGGDVTGPVARVIQGLSIPSGPAGVVTIPARAFAIPFGPHQQLAFSENPADTLFSIDCADIGSGGVSLELFNHLGGQAGPPAATYLVGDDGRRFCTAPEAKNDSLKNATLLDDCEVFGQFNASTLEANELSISTADTVGGTVWYQFDFADDQGIPQNIRIRPADSLFYAIYPDLGSLDGAQIPFASGLISQDTTPNICWPGESFERWSLQLQQVRPGKISRFYLQLQPEPNCPSSSDNSILANEVARLSIYPNPARGLVSVEIPGSGNDVITYLYVFASSGRLVLQPNSNPFDVSSLAPGVYWVAAGLPNGERFLRKLIKI